jgi:radical SAM-linked protein
MVRDKVRIRFRKIGDLRLVSHHDLMRTFERMLRRAALPFHSTAGFNPRPRLVFALSLGLGIVGADEVLELELDETLPPEEVHERLRRQCPPGLEIMSVRRIEPKITAQVRRVTYRLPLPAPEPDLPTRAAELLLRTEVSVERTRPQPRRCDIRPYLCHLRAAPDAIEMDFWVTPTGTARPDEVLALLGLGRLLQEGAVLERTSLELHDESQEPFSRDSERNADPALPSAAQLNTTLKGNA